MQARVAETQCLWRPNLTEGLIRDLYLLPRHCRQLFLAGEVGEVAGKISWGFRKDPHGSVREEQERIVFSVLEYLLL